jgi:protein-L-isoaspartate(D-aspartate) O-methyltransferase
MGMEDGADAPVQERVEPLAIRSDGALANFLISLRSSGIRRSAIISAFEETQRRFFLPPDLRAHAYAGFPLPIGCGEEATPPSLIARVLALADPGGTERVLEIGTGSGYQTALLARLCRSVVSVERWRTLSERAAFQLHREALRNVELRHADGLALDGQEKFDLVVINAALAVVPPAVLALVKPDGRIVVALTVDGQPTLARLDVSADGPVVSHHGAIALSPIRAGLSVAL